MTTIQNNKKGGSMIEILVVIAIIATTLTSLLGLISFSLKITTLTRQTSQANNIAKGIMEQVRNFRDGTNWNTDGLGTLITDTNYYVQKSGSPPKWQLFQGTKTINNFTQKVIFGDVMRNENDDIVISGGTNNPDTKKITATVSWEEKGTAHQIELVTYLTNWR